MGWQAGVCALSLAAGRGKKSAPDTHLSSDEPPSTRGKTQPQRHIPHNPGAQPSFRCRPADLCFQRSDGGFQRLGTASERPWRPRGSGPQQVHGVSCDITQSCMRMLGGLKNWTLCPVGCPSVRPAAMGGEGGSWRWTNGKHFTISLTLQLTPDSTGFNCAGPSIDRFLLINTARKYKCIFPSL